VLAPRVREVKRALQATRLNRKAGFVSLDNRSQAFARLHAVKKLAVEQRGILGAASCGFLKPLLPIPD
jgi:hypothetical protein